jgi:hypothetical protein
VSRRTDAKKARRRKRRATREASWLLAGVVDDLETASALDDFDRLLTDRGWEFSEESLDDDVEGVAWWWPPSQAAVDAPDERVEATVILLMPEDDGEIAHVVPVGTSTDYQFGLDELVDHLDAVEAYRLGAPLPTF